MMSERAEVLLAELLGELKALREEHRRTRLMMARVMAMQIGLAKPMTAGEAARVEANLMLLDESA